MLSATVEDVRGLSKYIEAFLADEFLCVVGNSERIKEENTLFMQTENLF